MMGKIGPYELLTSLEGGTHPLFKAKNAEGQIVALKAIPLKTAGDEAQARFLREAEIAKTLDHTNLLKVIDSGSDSGHLFQVMELLEGMDLRKIISRQFPLTWEQRLLVMEQVCDGLGYAHARGLVHRDLKPANIFVENGGRVRLLDFGMARIQGSNLTRAGIALGTLNYMAPEQIRGEQCTTATDVFSCGIIFYELITGRHPFSFGSTGLTEILNSVMFQTPPPLNELAPDTPPAIQSVIAQALEKDAARRPQNGSELRGMLRACRTGLAGEAAPAPAPKPAVDDLGATRKFRRVDMEALKAKAPPPEPAPKAVEPKAPEPEAKSSVNQARPDSVYCPACTRANSKGAVVCKHCGSSLMATTHNRIPVFPKESKRTQWIVTGVIVAVILAAAVFVILRLRP